MLLKWWMTGVFILLLSLVSVFASPTMSADEPRAEGLTVHVFDVGYGDAILVHSSAGAAVLIDAGSAETEEHLLYRLKQAGIEKLDTLIITHPHENHFGGARRVIESFAVNKLYYNGDDARAESGFDQVMEAVRQKDIPVAVLTKGDDVPMATEEFSLTVLQPGDLALSINENCLALLLSYRHVSVLLTADIQPRQQAEILRAYPELADVDAVQIPHHGGLLASEFVEFLKGKIVFMSTGPNIYDKPLQEEIPKIPGRLLRTDKHGTITLWTDGNTINVATEKE
jgi:competence protein ComEC